MSYAEGPFCPSSHPHSRSETFRKTRWCSRGLGTFRVKFKGSKRNLDLFIMEGSYTSLLDMSCLLVLGIGLTGINQASIAALPASQNFKRVCNEFPEVFDGKLRIYKCPLVTLPLDPVVWPTSPLPMCS